MSNGSVADQRMNGDSDNNGVGELDAEVRFFKHPRVLAFYDHASSACQELSPYAVHAMLAPNFKVAPLSAAPDLERGFDTGLSLAAAGAGAAAVAKHQTKNSKEKPLFPRGYALKIDGALPLSTQERIYHALPAWDAALGTSMYKIEKIPDALKSTDDAVVAALTEKAQDKLPHLISPSHSVSIGRTSNAFDGDSFALFVTANDVPAARRLVQYTATRAKHGKPLTLEDLILSPEYESLHKTSQAMRDYIAERYAAAYGVQLKKGEQAHTTLTHSASRADDLAHGAHESLNIHRARESRYYTVYNDATDASRAQEGRVVLQHGIMGGHTVLANRDGKAWYQPHFLSVIPSNSVEAYDGETKVTAIHADDDARTKRAFAARVAWHSDLGTKFPHSAARQYYNSMGDQYTTHWLSHLSPLSTTTGGTAPLEQKSYTLVVGQLPNISTLYATPEELAALSRFKSTPESVPVALDNQIVSRIPILYDTAIRQSGYPLSLDRIFRDTYTMDSEPGTFGRLYEHSALDSDDDPTLFVDADQYGLSRRTGCSATQSVGHADAEWLPLTPEELNQLRLQAGLHPERRPSQTIINMDKKLLRLLTMPPPPRK